MIRWQNLDTLESWKQLASKAEKVDLKEELAGEKGAGRVKACAVPMGGGLTYYYGAKQVNESILTGLAALAEEAQLSEKYQALYEGDVINTGEKRRVLHQLTRGQLGKKVEADGTDKRAFYLEQQRKIAEFAGKVHRGEIVNERGEKFTTEIGRAHV